MRKFLAVFFVLTLVCGGISKPAYAVDCTQDTVIDKFGDWFGNLGKPESKKQRSIAIRRTNRLARCAEEQAQNAAKAAKKS